MDHDSSANGVLPPPAGVSVDFDATDQRLSIASPSLDLTIHASARELLALASVRDADWNLSASLPIGTSLEHQVFWCAGATPDTAVVLVGEGDELWELALNVPVVVIDEIVRQAAVAEAEQSMIVELQAAVLPLLPLRIDWVERHEPGLSCGGDGWSLWLTCPWQLVRGAAQLVQGTTVLTAWDDPGVDAAARDLVGREITDVHPRVKGNDEDPVFGLTGDLRLQVIADTDLDPWGFYLPGRTFVGRRHVEGSSSPADRHAPSRAWASLTSGVTRRFWRSRPPRG